MILHVIPICGAARDIFDLASCLLVVTPVVPSEVPSADVIQGLLDLTPAEARVARAIANGETVEKIAAALSVSRGTVRVQLSSVFDKTGTKRQADLVRLLAGSAPHQQALSP